MPPVDIAPGLWVWRLQHPAWRTDADWEPHVTSTVVETGGEVALIDPLVPPDDDREVWERLDAAAPTLVVVLKPDHVRDVDLFVRRYDAQAFGPSLFWRDDVPEGHRTSSADRACASRRSSSSSRRIIRRLRRPGPPVAASSRARHPPEDMGGG